MKNNVYFKVLISLLALTILAAFVAKFGFDLKVAAAITLALFTVKFIGVAFYFMELKRAHILWKSSVLIFVSIFLAIILIIV